MSIISVLRGLSVVLPVIISTMAALMVSGINYNMLVQKSCSPTGPPANINKFICPDTAVYTRITEILSTKSSLQAVTMAIGGFVFGFLRDLTGKSKLLMYVGILGETTSACVAFMSAYYWNSSPWIISIMQAFSSGAFGESVMQMGAICILMAESTPDTLPLRMQLYIASTLTTALIGGFLTTVIVTTFGYLWLLTLCIGLHVMTLLLVGFMVRSKSYDRKTWTESWEGIRKVFRWRENVTVLWLMLITLAVGPNIMISESLHNSKFLQIKFHYSMYQSLVIGLFGFVVGIVGSMVGPLVLSKVFHCSQLTIGVIVCVCNSIAAFLHAFIDTQVLLYLAAVAYFMKLAALPLPNTIIKNIVDKDELGIYLGINAILTSCLPIGITALYQKVSNMTIDTWVGAFYFVSCGCFMFLALIFGVSRCLYIEPTKNAEDEGEEDSHQNGKTILATSTTEI